MKVKPATTDAQTETILNAVLDAGINYIDTSIDYGVSEERIGRDTFAPTQMDLLLKQHKPGREGGFAQPAPPPIPCRHATGPRHGTGRPRRPPRLRAGLRRADPLHAAHARLLHGDRLHHAVSLGAPHRRALHPAAQAPAPAHAWPSSPPPRRTSRTKATRVPARPTTAARSSTSPIPATRRTTHDLRISHIGYDRVHTSARRTAAPGSRCPPCAAPSPPAASAPWPRASTARRPTAAIASPMETDAPEILRRCREDGADAAILVPNCPVCHQTCSLVARHLEANGIPTVLMGCAKDIVEHAAVPRFLFSDFPLGNSAGKPHDVGLAGPDAGTRVARAGGGARPAHHDAVAAALERGRIVEAGLPEHRAHAARRTRPPPPRVRRAEGRRPHAPRGKSGVTP